MKEPRNVLVILKYECTKVVIHFPEFKTTYFRPEDGKGTKRMKKGKKIYVN